MKSRFTALLLPAIAVVLCVFTIEGVGRCQATQRDIDALANQSLVYVATVRKDGNQSKAVPIWFTETPDHLILLNTSPTSWKVKRVRRGSPMMVWIGKASGPAFIGKAELTKDPAVLNQLISDYPHKYWLAWMGLFSPSMKRYDNGAIVAIKITPVRDLPDGFQSQPGTPAPPLDAAQH